MSLDALAPDQRAVVQLVLQQDRSYEDLAALLGITPEAVRERAHRGMERLAPGEAVDPADRAQIADYLLGQQSVSGRESTRALLTSSQPARSWALALAADLSGIARGTLPDVPGGVDSAPEPEPEPVEPVIMGDSDPILEDPIAPARARPRPRQRAQETTPPADFGFGEAAGAHAASDETAPDGGEPARTSRLGGALLIAGLAIFVAALVVWLVSRGGDEDPGAETATTGTTSTATTPGATVTPGATPDYQPIALLQLKPTGDIEAKGRVIVFGAQTGEVAFNVTASGVPVSAEGEAYGLWLTGGPESHFLGYAGPVGEDGKLRTSGPRDSDAAQFATWLGDQGAKVVISVETEEGATEPGDIVLQGAIADAKTGSPAAGAAATPTP